MKRRDTRKQIETLLAALQPFAEAANWFDHTQNYLDGDMVAEKEKQGLGVMRIDVGHLRAAKRAVASVKR